MRKCLLITAMILLVLIVGMIYLYPTHAQTGNVVYIAPAAGTTVTNCGTPTSGAPVCGVATGWYGWSGTAWQCYAGPCLTSTAVVNSITVCNAAGASCGTPVSGAVQLNVPKTVTVTGSLQ